MSVIWSVECKKSIGNASEKATNVEKRAAFSQHFGTVDESIHLQPLIKTFGMIKVWLQSNGNALKTVKRQHSGHSVKAYGHVLYNGNVQAVMFHKRGRFQFQFNP